MRNKTTTDWKQIWQKGFAPLLPTTGLEALAKALRDDDPHLIQQGTIVPPPLMCVQDWPVEAACPIAFIGWKSDVLEADTVGCVEEFFARSCYEADCLLDEVAGCRHFLNFWDETPRSEAIYLLLSEVERELARRNDLEQTQTTCLEKMP